MVGCGIPTGIQAIVGDPVSLAVSVVGFGELWSTAFRHYTYIDDVNTLWAALDCGVGSDRAPAPRLFMQDRARISAHRFSLEVESS
jgi:hypothetical protein